MSSVTQTPSPLVRLFALCLTLLPPCLLAVLIFTYGVDFPQWDEWTYVEFFEKFSRGALTFSHLFAQVNEYRQFFPNLVFVVVGQFTHWNLRYEMWATFLVAGVISFDVYRLSRLTSNGTFWPRVLQLFLANLLIFSPHQYMNWLQGQQLVYYIPIACVTTCILVAHSRLPPIVTFLICGCLASISTFSSANGVVCWIVVLPILLTASHIGIASRRWLVAAWALGLLSNAAVYLHGYQKPWWSPSPLLAFRNPLGAVAYFLGFVGAPLGLERGKLSAPLGLLFVSLYAVGCVLLVRFRDDSRFVRRLMPWLAVGCYSVLTGVMTMIGRLGFGLGQSMNTRYIGYSVYLVVALVFLTPLICEKFTEEPKILSSRRAAQITATAAIALLLWQPLLIGKGIDGMKVMRRQMLQAKAGVLLINYVWDTGLVNTLYPDLSFLAAQANILDKLGYLRPGMVKSNRLQDFEGGKASGVSYGSLDQVETHDDVYVVSGIATLPYRNEAPDAVILAYQQPNGDCILFAATHSRLGSAGSLGPGKQGRQRWEVSFTADKLPTRPATLTAWAFDANSARAYRLDASYVVR